jgi:hypothetical protein
MRFALKTTALVVAGAVALALLAYGIGTQVGGGSAVAENDGSSSGDRDGWQRGDWGRGPGADLDGLADELGVDADRLEDALQDFHKQKEGVWRDDFAAALADELGISTARVKSGLDRLKDERVTSFSKRLADELGVDADRVKAALDRRLDADRPRDPADFAEQLAKDLGLDVDKVERALWSAGPGMDRWHRGWKTSLRRMASALGVETGDLRRALRVLRDDAGTRLKDKRDELARFLADRLDLSVDKVKDALPDPPRGDFRGWHRGGPPGPGGPGFGPGGPGGPGFGPGGPGGGPGPGGPPGGPGGFGFGGP